MSELEDMKKIKRMTGDIYDDFENMRWSLKQRRLRALYLSDWIVERNR